LLCNARKGEHASMSLAATLIPAAVGASYATPGGLRLRAAAARAPSPLLAAHAADSSEFCWLKDRLMEEAVAQQVERFRFVGDLAQGMWLKSAWQSFNEEAKQSSDSKPTPGTSWQFLVGLQYTGQEGIMIPTRRPFRQGSPNNPYLNQQQSDHRFEMIRPQGVAQRLVACREQLAEEWSDSLRLLGSGEPHEVHPHEPLLASVATRCAVRGVIDDLSQVSETRNAGEYLKEATGRISLDLGPEGGADDMLDQLAARPMCIRGSTLIDPPQMTELIRDKCKAVELEMAEPVLSSTLADHCELYSAFLDACWVGN